MDALNQATVAKLRECAAAMTGAAIVLRGDGWKDRPDHLLKQAESAEALADDIERAEGGK